MKRQIAILLDNGELRTWGEDEFTEYDIKGRFFVVINGEKWVGMYALDRIVSMEVDHETD